jgi:predicted negative regulator of RcsB-dependent stress response
MNLEVKDITTKIVPAMLAAKKYLVFIFFIAVLLIYGYLVFHINTLASQQPNEDAVTERLKTVQRPKIDEDALNKIEQLEDQNIQVQTLFQQARDNPFVE